MYSCPPWVIDRLAPEYQYIALTLFPPESAAPMEGPAHSTEAAQAFAGLLGIEVEYDRLLGTTGCGPEIRKLLEHFSNNMDLLIQKTWVERVDELRKERLRDRIPGFLEELDRGDYQKVLLEFSHILEELSYLLFGTQSHRNDFAEYVFRIDVQMGFFWWYGAQLPRLSRVEDRDFLWAVILLGICYLTNF
ncbi:MAG: hypothetical protein LBT11_04255 [Treponema sp.]|jgi:hypothetical protein|nr:hypothetical protein [Treponema sp.]